MKPTNDDITLTIPTKYYEEATDPKDRKAIEDIRFAGLGGLPEHFIRPRQKMLERSWARKHGLQRSGAAECMQKLVGKKCGGARKGCNCTPPFPSHVSFWLKGQTPHFYVSHPYDLDRELLAEMNRFCAENGLGYCITTEPSFHNPGKTYLVVYYALGVDVSDLTGVHFPAVAGFPNSARC